MPNIETVRNDLLVLAKLAEEELKEKRWASYIAHVPEVNRLLEACKEVGIDVEGIEPIEDVPKENRGGSPEEQAKVSEVARKANQLYRRSRQAPRGRP